MSLEPKKVTASHNKKHKKEIAVMIAVIPDYK